MTRKRNATTPYVVLRGTSLWGTPQRRGRGVVMLMSGVPSSFAWQWQAGRCVMLVPAWRGLCRCKSSPAPLPPPPRNLSRPLDEDGQDRR